MTENQIEILKSFISRAEDARNFRGSDYGRLVTKGLMVFLINGSEKLQKDVCLSIIAKEKSSTTSFSVEQLGYIHDSFQTIISSNYFTRANNLLGLMGSNMKFSVRYGYLNPSDERDKEIALPCYTFWLAESFYPETASLLDISKKGLEDLAKR